MSNFADFSVAIEAKLDADEALKQLFDSNIAEHLANAGFSMMRTRSKQVITAEAFWWGYHFVIPKAAMNDFSNAGATVAAFMSLGGSAIVASGGTLAPLVAVGAAYVVAELALMKAVDQGKGVYLSGTWAAPAILVPTAIV